MAKFMRVRDTASMPSRMNPGDAGLDLASCDRWVLPGGGGRAIIPTGWSVAVPEGTYGRVAPRSGLAANFGIDVLAGVIDRSYRGEICVILVNHGGLDFVVDPGYRVAQLIFEKIADPGEFTVVESLEETSRGSGGFGSTGI